eukprot:scaffold40950_cov18-Prasinocladus_malaysianus.AAC.1
MAKKSASVGFDMLQQTVTHFNELSHEASSGCFYDATSFLVLLATQHAIDRKALLMGMGQRASPLVQAL